MIISKLLAGARSKALRVLLAPPYESQWSSYSYVGSASTERALPSPTLLDVATEAIQAARQVSFVDLAERVNLDARKLLQQWPGEHYRLLAAICATMKPKSVIEIGTASGLSALAMLSVLPADARLVSFDIFPWDYRGPDAWGGETLLRNDDFRDGRLRHEVGDLTQTTIFDKHRSLIEKCDLFFIDGPKDGAFERSFLARLETVKFTSQPILVFDDIKLWNMLAIWHEIRRSKLDLTSFGHWSGTGLVHWNGQA